MYICGVCAYIDMYVCGVMCVYTSVYIWGMALCVYVHALVFMCGM